MRYYLLVENLDNFLDVKCKNKLIILFGASTFGARIIEKLKTRGAKVDFICDNDHMKWGTNFYNIKVISPLELIKYKESAIILISSQFVKEISFQLFSMGFKQVYYYDYGKGEIDEWIKKGKPLPPPAIYKYQLIRRYGKRYGIEILIETGTYHGDMINANKDYFRNIYSIELDKTLYTKAQIRFQNISHVRLIYGDSSIELSKLLKKIKQPSLFWLDAHYSGEGTAIGDKETPIESELRLILKHDIKSHVILIDDARLFGSNSNYPSISKIKQIIKGYNRKLKVIVKDDIIRIH